MRLAPVLTALVMAGATAVYFVPAPAGVPQEAVHAAALVLLTVGLWAVGALPEYVIGLIFFTLAMILAVAPAEVVFSGFASNTLWLVLGGLVMAEAVQRSGLADRIAGALFGRFMGSYAQLVTATVTLAFVLSFVMPATVSRTFLLPYQVPPVLVGMQVGGVRIATMLRLSLPLAILSIVLLLPLQYFWWRVIGYFG